MMTARPASRGSSSSSDGWNERNVLRDEIIEAANTGPIICRQDGVTVVRVRQHAVLKYGHEVRLSEAWNIQLVRKRTDVPIPAVIDAWETGISEADDDEGIGYILMEYIEGKLISDIWSTLDVHIQLDIHFQLKTYIQQLRSIRMDSPGPVGGDLSRGALFTDYGAGPFKSHNDIESWFNERLLVCQEFGRVPLTQPSFHEHFDTLVMCHMDIAARNLILDGQGKVWLLDWAHAVGYPTYFEKASLIRTGDPNFTQGLLEMIGHEYQEEVEQLLAIGFALTTAAMTRPTQSLSVTECTS